MLNVALIGFGGITRVHRSAYLELEKRNIARLVAAFDVDPSAYEKKQKINIDAGVDSAEEKVNFYSSLDEMLASEKIDFVDICIPTFLHSDMAVDMLSRGYHVMCEKPMALNYAECERMLRAAEESGRELMIGQCMRFAPEYDFIKAAISDGRFGKVIGALFTRLSAPPTWGWENWFMNPERSGGCLTDLHIHDVDLIRYLFGEPEAVSVSASSSVCVNDTVHSSFCYGAYPVTAIGDWTLSGMNFSAVGRVNFERASLTVDDSGLTVYPKESGEPYKVELPREGRYYLELEYFSRVVSGEFKNEKNPPSSAAKTIRLIELMRESINKNGEKILLSKG